MSEMPEIRYAEWVDSASPGNQWVNVDEEIGTAVCQSVGFVLSETDDTLVLGGDISEHQNGRLIAIPKVAILKSRTLRKGKQP